MMHVGNFMSTVERIQYHGGYLEYRGSVQYCGGYYNACGGYYEYHRGVQYPEGTILCHLSTPQY